MGPQANMALAIRRAALAGLRSARAAPVAARQMSTSMDKAEELSMQRLYPMYRTSWFGEPDSKGTWDATRKRWVIVEAYPLFAAIGFGCMVCFLHCMRHLFFSPDVFISKGSRGNAMIENFKEGEAWKGNVFRSAGSLKKDPTDAFR